MTSRRKTTKTPFGSGSLLLRADTDTRKCLQMNHVDTRNQILEIPAVGCLYDPLRFLLNDSWIPLGNTSQECLEGKKILVSLIVLQAQFPCFLEDRLHTLYDSWGHDTNKARAPLILGLSKARQ